MNLDTLTRPYQWPVLGPWLRERARERGRERAHRLFYDMGVPLEDVQRYASQEIVRASTLVLDSWLYEAIGQALEARKIAATLRRTNHEHVR